MLAPMPNHPNRGRGKALGRTPKPEEVRAAREAAGLSQTAAAALIHATLRTWQNWEADESDPNHRRMHPGLWELFLLKLK